jgi:transcriptional regulator with XRE-family HTH domain
MRRHAAPCTRRVPHIRVSAVFVILSERGTIRHFAVAFRNSAIRNCASANSRLLERNDIHHSRSSLEHMEIGEKLRELREAKNLSQGDIEERTGLHRAYVSRVEHDHTVPTVGTLEKFAHALGIPLYRFFTDEESVVKPKLPSENSSWGTHGKERGAFQKLTKALSRMDEQDRKLLLNMAERMARRGAKR